MAPLTLNHQKSPCGSPPPLPLHPLDHPFVRGFRRASAGLAEFEAFAHRLTDLEVRVTAIPRLDGLRDVYGLFAEHVEGQTVQFRFGSHHTRRRLPTETGWRVVAEKGPALVYSLGPDGTVAVMLYPARSDVMRASEDIIFLAVGRPGFTSLLDRVEGDLKALAAYGHATALDGTPTFGEWLKVQWLRKFHPHTTDDRFQTATLGAGAVGWFMTKTLLTASLNALVRPIFLILVVWWLVTYQSDLAALLPGSTIR